MVAMVYRAVIFDMDGTLTRPRLNFDAIRADIGLTSREPILEAIARMTLDAQRRAEGILHGYEEEAARKSELNDGATELVAWLAGNGTRLGLITRNSRCCVEITCRKHALAFESIVARADATPKPSPEGVLKICRELTVAPAEACIVGDYAFDIDSGRAAGCGTIAILHGRRPDWAERADGRVDTLTELLETWRREGNS